MTDVTALDIENAVRARYPRAAVVRELTTSHDRNRRRIDLLMFENTRLTAIEIKVSMEDYRRESDEKRGPWLRITHRFVYAVPAGLDIEVPKGIGLWWIHPDGELEIRQRASIRVPEPIPERTVQTLAYRTMNAELAVAGIPRPRRRRKRRKRGG